MALLGPLEVGGGPVGCRLSMCGVSLDAETSDRLTEALAAAVQTADQPLVATVAVTVARLVVARGEPVLAARAVGAAAVLRGAPDDTDLCLVRLPAQLRAALGPGELDRLTTPDTDRAGAIDLLVRALHA